MLSRRALLVPAVVVSLLVPGLALAGCSATPAADAEAFDGEASAPAAEYAWVVVMFEGRDDEFDVNLMDALLETELAADEALAAADAGWIDGNDVGAHGYELYFVGDDASTMWRALEPVFATAPVAWTRVELRNSFEDPAPKVLTQD
ncbi:hypothetical protein [Agromyces sp. NPDC055661]